MGQMTGKCSFGQRLLAEITQGRAADSSRLHYWTTDHHSRTSRSYPLLRHQGYCKVRSVSLDWASVVSVCCASAFCRAFMQHEPLGRRANDHRTRIKSLARRLCNRPVFATECP